MLNLSDGEVDQEELKNNTYSDVNTWDHDSQLSGVDLDQPINFGNNDLLDDQPTQLQKQRTLQ